MDRQPKRAPGTATVRAIRHQARLSVVIGGALTCLVIAGRYDILPDSPALCLTADCACDGGEAPDAKNGSSDPDVRLSVWLDSADRMIVSSLDRGARLHEVQIRRPQQSSWQPADAARPGQSTADFAIVPQYSQGSMVRSQPDLNANSPSVPQLEVCGYRHLTSAAHELVAEIPMHERLFRLPQYLSGREENSTIAHFSERVVMCPSAAASNLVHLYTAELQLSTRSIESLVATIEEAIIATAAGQVGPVADVDGDDRLSVVVCELSVNSIDAETPLRGCVRAADFLTEGPLRGDIIYLDYRLLGTDALAPVVVHEITHAAIFSRLRQLRYEGHAIAHLPGWLNEAIAHSCEYRSYPASPNLAERIAAYLQRPGQSPLMLPAGAVPDDSGRGPMRAAGLFYVEFLRQEATVAELIDRQVMVNCPHEHPEMETFAQTFRRWTVWMSDRQQTGELTLRLRALPCAGSVEQFTVRGTAVTWWYAERAGLYTITATHNCAPQVTIVKANQTPLSVGHSAE